MDYFELALQLSRKRLRESSLAVYRSMWGGYVARLALETAAHGPSTPGAESSEQLVDALEGSGDYMARKRVFGLIRWTYDTLRVHGISVGNPTKPVERHFMPDWRPNLQTLDLSWVERMALAASETCTGWKQARLTAIVYLLCETALKNKELVDLRLDSLEGSMPLRLSAGRRKHTREFELSANAAHYVEGWIRVRPEVTSDYLFVADATGRPMDHTTLWRQLKRVTMAVPGYDQVNHFGTGLIRATKAQELRAKGLKVSQIAEFLGHRQETSTDEMLERVPRRRGSVSSQRLLF